MSFWEPNELARDRFKSSQGLRNFAQIDVLRREMGARLEKIFGRWRLRQGLSIGEPEAWARYACFAPARMLDIEKSLEKSTFQKSASRSRPPVSVRSHDPNAIR